ncbi:MAG: hypothetical protein ABSB52_07495 [Acidimicrobiales bacterium]
MTITDPSIVAGDTIYVLPPSMGTISVASAMSARTSSALGGRIIAGA